jgi:hypothetical protein
MERIEDFGIPFTPCGLSYAAIREYAARVGVHHDIYDESGLVDVKWFAEKLGGEIVPAAGRARDTRLVEVFSQGRFNLYDDLYLLSAVKQRFFHVLGVSHYYLHYLYPKRKGILCIPRGVRGHFTVEANVFASALLIRSDVLVDRWSPTRQSIITLADDLQVSKLMVITRAKSLGLVSQDYTF